jgi:ribosome-binding factor A
MKHKAEPSERMHKMSSQIHQIIANLLLTSIKDPDLEGVTITDVEMTGDLQNAYVFWTTYDEPEYAIKALRKSNGRFRHALAEKLGTRLTPQIRFIHDEVGRKVHSLDDLLAKAQADDARVAKLRESNPSA